MKIIFLTLSVAVISLVCLGKSKQEKRGEEINFQSIKSVLENDFLKESALKKAKKFKRMKRKRVRRNKKKFSNPKEADFWTFFSELWLVRNAQRFKMGF